MSNDIQNYKLVIVGDTNVGKTQLFSIYNNIDYMKEATILANYKTKKVKISDDGIEKTVKINMWDVSGCDTYQSMLKNYYTGIHGIIFIFDLTNRDSFHNIPKWMERINDVIDLTTIAKILIGNKSDKTPQVSNAEIYDMTVIYGMHYFETTNTIQTSVKNAFDYIVNEIVKTNSSNRNNSFVLREGDNNAINVRNNDCCTIS